MQGKILGFDNLQGVIRSEDGKRYNFHISEVKNAKNVDLETLSGSEVDFELTNGEAVEIYITKFQQNAEFMAFKNANFNPNSNQSMNSNSQNNNSQQIFKKPQNPEVRTLKNKFYIALGILIGGTILLSFVGGIISYELTGDTRLGGNIISLFVFLLYFILFYNIIKFVQEHSRSDDLGSVFVLYNVLSSVVIVLYILSRFNRCGCRYRYIIYLIHLYSYSFHKI